MIQTCEELHGELLIYRDNETGPELLNRSTSNGLANSLRLGTPLPEGHTAQLHVWDLVSTEDPDRLYMERLVYLERAVNTMSAIKLIDTRIVHSIEEARAHYAEARENGLEGTVIKQPKLPWKSHTSKLQVKLKNEAECDLEIVAKNPGTGRNIDTFGSLVCVTACGGLQVNVGGFTDDMRQEISDNWGQWENSIISVMFNELVQDKRTGEYTLFLPRFKESRIGEKDTADTLARIRQM